MSADTSRRLVSRAPAVRAHLPVCEESRAATLARRRHRRARLRRGSARCRREKLPEGEDEVPRVRFVFRIGYRTAEDRDGQEQHRGHRAGDETFIRDLSAERQIDIASAGDLVHDQVEFAAQSDSRIERRTEEPARSGLREMYSLAP